MSDWFERASAQLEQDLAEGFITYDEFKAQMKDLRAELRESERGCDDGGY